MNDKRAFPPTFYEAHAESYDKIVPLMPFYQAAVGRHLSILTRIAARCVLDLGCGTGNVAIPVAFGGSRVVAVDPSGPMLARLKAKADGFDVTERIVVIERRAEDAAFDDRKYDAVTCLLAAFCMEDAAGVLGRAISRLEAGGVLVLTEPIRSFQEEPLLRFGEETLFNRLDREDLRDHWNMVCEGGRELGRGIRCDDSMRADEVRLRADDLPSLLERLGCRILANNESHLGQCRFIVACRAT